MNILLTNEEGCFAPGIIALAKVLSMRHRVCIVAPLNPQRGVSHTFTTSSAPLRVRQYYVLNKVKMFSVNGTPCDCVALALDKLLKSKPDLIISGIDSTNHRGETIYTSGIVSAAIEGTIHGIKSISLSSKSEIAKDEKDFLRVARAFAKMLDLFKKMVKQDTTLNINYPANFIANHIKYCHLTQGLIDNSYIEEVNPFGARYFWLKSPKLGYKLTALEQKGDLYWLKKNFITVTPLKLNLTNADAIDELEKANFKI